MEREIRTQDNPGRWTRWVVNPLKKLAGTVGALTRASLPRWLGGGAADPAAQPLLPSALDVQEAGRPAAHALEPTHTAVVERGLWRMVYTGGTFLLVWLPFLVGFYSESRVAKDYRNDIANSQDNTAGCTTQDCRDEQRRLANQATAQRYARLFFNNDGSLNGVALGAGALAGVSMAVLVLLLLVRFQKLLRLRAAQEYNNGEAPQVEEAPNPNDEEADDEAFGPVAVNPPQSQQVQQGHSNPAGDGASSNQASLTAAQLGGLVDKTIVQLGRFTGEYADIAKRIAGQAEAGVVAYLDSLNGANNIVMTPAQVGGAIAALRGQLEGLEEAVRALVASGGTVEAFTAAMVAWKLAQMKVAILELIEVDNLEDLDAQTDAQFLRRERFTSPNPIEAALAKAEARMMAPVLEGLREAYLDTITVANAADVLVKLANVHQRGALRQTTDLDRNEAIVVGPQNQFRDQVKALADLRFAQGENERKEASLVQLSDKAAAARRVLVALPLNEMEAIAQDSTHSQKTEAQELLDIAYRSVEGHLLNDVDIRVLSDQNSANLSKAKSKLQVLISSHQASIDDLTVAGNEMRALEWAERLVAMPVFTGSEIVDTTNELLALRFAVIRMPALEEFFSERMQEKEGHLLKLRSAFLAELPTIEDQALLAEAIERYTRNQAKFESTACSDGDAVALLKTFMADVLRVAQRKLGELPGPATPAPAPALTPSTETFSQAVDALKGSQNKANAAAMGKQIAEQLRVAEAFLDRRRHLPAGIVSGAIAAEKLAVEVEAHYQALFTKAVQDLYPVLDRERERFATLKNQLEAVRQIYENKSPAGLSVALIALRDTSRHRALVPGNVASGSGTTAGGHRNALFQPDPRGSRGRGGLETSSSRGRGNSGASFRVSPTNRGNRGGRGGF